MQPQKIKKTSSVVLPLILAGLVTMHIIPFMAISLLGSLSNGDFSLSKIITINVLELLIVVVCIGFAVRAMLLNKAYKEAKRHKGLTLHPTYMMDTGTRINRVPQYEITLANGKKEFTVKATIQAVPINDPLFYEAMKDVPLTVYPLKGDYYISPAELTAFRRALIEHYNIARNNVMKTMQEERGQHV